MISAGVSSSKISTASTTEKAANTLARDEAEYCDRVSIMDGGKIEALDTPAKLKEMYRAKNMDEVFLKIAR